MSKIQAKDFPILLSEVASVDIAPHVNSNVKQVNATLFYFIFPLGMNRPNGRPIVSPLHLLMGNKGGDYFGNISPSVLPIL